ncbi:MAG: hypothetical protein U0K91_07285 [Acutalibacteraceae bacterium]|nr:hypothetical protein [Acutalibacteraceae bacterium]
MSYQKQNFENDQVLTAEHLNAIEAGIVQNEEDIKKKADIDDDGKLNDEQLPENVLTEEDLEEAINTALTQAKDSGEFDGKDGQDGTNGKDGADGKDGTSVTITNITESTADKGSNVVSFSDGKTLTVKNGSKGSKGDKGDKGADGSPGEKGADGKSAYQYAKDGGYTGTETEFAEKLAKESVVYVNITENEDGTYSADKTAAELVEAYNKGCAIYAVHGVDDEKEIYDLLAFTTIDYTAFVFRLMYEEGAFYFYITNEGGEADEVTFEEVPIGGGGDIPEALPNPEALTINGKEYNGSEAVSIDTTPFEIKITADENGTYTSNKTGEEIIAAYEKGRQLFCADGTVRIPLTKHDYLLNNLKRSLEFFSSSGTTYKSILIKFKVNSKVINSITVSEGTYATEKEENTVDTRNFVFNVTGNSEDGYTSDTAWNEVLAAYGAGINIVCHYCGEMFTDFYVPLVAVNEGELLFGVSPMSGVYVFVSVTSDGVYAEETLIDMTINGEVWDLTASIDFTDTINQMIDDKLGVIENGSY